MDIHNKKKINKSIYMNIGKKLKQIYTTKTRRTKLNNFIVHNSGSHTTSKMKFKPKNIGN